MSSEPSTHLEVPEEIRRATAGKHSSLGCVIAGIAFAVPVLLYLGVFGLLLIDAFVLGTNYVSTPNVSPTVIEAIQVIYSPLIFLMNWIMNW
jgi:hypothetical protein